MADPASETFYGMGRMASGIEIPYEGEDYCALKDVPHGEIRIKNYYSTVLAKWRQFYIYTPPGYDVNRTNDTLFYIYCMAAARMNVVGVPGENQFDS